MEVSLPVIIVLVALFLVFGLLLTKYKRNKYVPFIGIAGAVFFLVYAFLNKDYMYPSLFFFLMAAYTGIRALLAKKKTG